MTAGYMKDEDFDDEYKKFCEEFTGWSWENIRRYRLVGIEFGQAAWRAARGEKSKAISNSARIAEG